MDPVRLFARRLGMVVLGGLVVFGVSAVWSVYGKEAESRILRAQAETELADLRQQEAQLNGNITKLKTARGKEEALREHYEMGRKGESLIIIVEPPQPEAVAEDNGIMQWVQKFLPFW